MINTLSIKQQQNQRGFFTTGSGPEVILIQGSCRTAPYVWYLDEWNKGIGNNRFTIHSIDPFNWSFDPITDALVDREAAINAMETHDDILAMIDSVDIFIHEHYESFGMFNTSDEQVENIYHFGMQPRIDLTIPNFHDVFILFSDHYKFDAEFREYAESDYKLYGKLSGTTQKWIRNKTTANLTKFYDVCRKSSYPQFAEIFEQWYKTTRFFHTFNHVAKAFTLNIFGLLQKDLKISLNDSMDSYIEYMEFLSRISSYDMFDSDSTPLTEYDVEVFGFNWREPVVSFKDYNKIGQ